MKRCCLQSELKALGCTLSEVGAHITPNKPYRAILMFQGFFLRLMFFSGCYFIHQNNSPSTSVGEHGNAFSLWSFRNVLWTTKSYPTSHWRECRNFHVKLAPVKPNKYYKIVAMMFWLGPFCILTTGTWRCRGSSSKLRIIFVFNCHFVSFIAEILTVNVKNTVIIVREENFDFETIAARGFFWPSDPTCWTTLRRKSRIRAMLIQFG